MLNRDFASHNAEVRDVWAAYHERHPIRVPMILGLNTRYFLLGEGAPFPDVSFERYFADPDLMFEIQLRREDYTRHHIVCDAPMGLPSEEEGWSIAVDLQNVYEAAWFGCDLLFSDDQVPDTVPRWQDSDRKREILDRGIPDPFSGIMEKNREYYEYFLRKAEAFEYRGRRVRHVSASALGTDGPLTVAANLRGATELFSDFLEDPDYVRELLDFVTEAIIVRITAWRRYLGQSEKQHGFAFADDSCQLISVGMYREFVLPCHQRLRRELSTDISGGSVHMCGDATRHFTTLRDALHIDSFDTGFPVDFGALRQRLGPDVQIQGGPEVALLRTGTPLAVAERTQQILESGIMQGGRFILREGNNLAPGTPLRNTEAMYESVKRYGRYDAN
jgi:uroporphyrinogen-III decarboxylase